MTWSPAVDAVVLVAVLAAGIATEDLVVRWKEFRHARPQK